MDINGLFKDEETFANFTKLQAEFSQIKSQKLRHRFRRRIRQYLFKIRRHILMDIPIDEKSVSSGIKEWIENQLDKNRQQSWETFTFTWDIAANDPFTVIQKEEWGKYGGSYDEHGFRTPPAFTEQEI